MATIVVKADLPTGVQADELVQTWLDAANAIAVRVAPCLDATDPAPTAGMLAEAKLILVGMITRWKEAGAGALESQKAGPFGQTVDTRVKTGYNPWPSELERLQKLCRVGNKKAFSVDTAPGSYGYVHRPWCNLFFGATYCSCGADIAGYPIFEA